MTTTTPNQPQPTAPACASQRMIDDAALHLDIKRIVDALEQIAAHLAPTINATTDDDRPLQVGDYVHDKTDPRAEEPGHIHAIQGNECRIYWDNMDQPGDSWWPLADFQRVKP